MKTILFFFFIFINTILLAQERHVDLIKERFENDSIVISARNNREADFKVFLKVEYTGNLTFSDSTTVEKVLAGKETSSLLTIYIKGIEFIDFKTRYSFIPIEESDKLMQKSVSDYKKDYAKSVSFVKKDSIKSNKEMSIDSLLNERKFKLEEIERLKQNKIDENDVEKENELLKDNNLKTKDSIYDVRIIEEGLKTKIKYKKKRKKKKSKKKKEIK